MNIEILYEDADVLAVNKPAGLIVHADGKTVEPTLVDWVLEKYPAIRGVGDKSPVNGQWSNVAHAERSGIVHRLDKETSGVMVIAKNQKAFEFLKKQFQEREMEKTYRAFVYGDVKNDEGVIDRPVARSTSDFRKWTATRGRRGAEREAVTEYRVLARAILPYQGEHSSSAARRGVRGSGTDTGFSFLDVHPKTGRTHQIRVHLKAINHPVVCDKLYAFTRRSRSEGGPEEPCALGFNRLALHAFSLTFKLPSGKTLTVEAPYPEDFEEALKILNKSLHRRPADERAG